jgi:protein AroM
MRRSGPRESPAGAAGAESGRRHDLGLLTLGQSPREDVTPTFRSVLGDSVRWLERGALDGLDPEALRAMEAKAGEPQLETRLRTGAAIGLSKAALMPRLVEASAGLARDCRHVLLLCSGEFPPLAAACPGLIQPGRILRAIIGAVAGSRRLGLIGPASDLVEAPGRWHPYAADLVCAPASPYGGSGAIEAAGRNLAERGADILYLNDMGFTDGHRLALARGTGLPVLCATTLTARVLTELVAR